MSVLHDNPSALVTAYVAWDSLHDTETKDLLNRAKFHFKELGVEVPDKKALQALVSDAQEIAAKAAYERDSKSLTEQEMAKYVRVEAARKWVFSKMAEVRRSAEKGGAIYEAARRDTIAKFERQSAGNVNEDAVYDFLAVKIKSVVIGVPQSICRFLKKVKTSFPIQISINITKNGADEKKD